jgi:hypothetical protein
MNRIKSIIGITIKKNSYINLKISKETISTLRKSTNQDVSPYLLILHIVKYRSTINKRDLRKAINDILPYRNATIIKYTKNLQDWGLLHIGSSYAVGSYGKQYQLIEPASGDYTYSFATSSNAGLVNLLYKVERKLERNEIANISRINHYYGIAYGGKSQSLSPEDASLINDMHNQNYKAFINSKKENRLYSIFTQMSKETRNRLISNRGMPLICIDIASSHPRILHKVLNSMQHLAPKDIFPIDLEIELAAWGRMASTDAYQLFQDKLGTSRSKAKRCLLMYFMDHWNRSHIPQIKIIMNEYFPLIHRLIQFFHTKERGTYTKIDKSIKIYSKERLKWSIALRLMSYEGDLILGSAQAFRLAHPNINIVTVHDCIMVDKDYADSIIDILQNNHQILDISYKTSIENSREMEEGEKRDNEPFIVLPKAKLPAQRSRTSMIQKDGDRFRISIKGRTYYSRASESRIDFECRAKKCGAILAHTESIENSMPQLIITNKKEIESE